MKLPAIALVAAFALSAGAANAHTGHHPSIEKPHHSEGMFQLHSEGIRLRPNYGNPNGNPDGPTTLSGTGDSQYGGSSAGTSGYN